MAEPFNVNILEQYHVSPPPDSIIPSISLPLTFLDIPWLLYPSNQTLFFFPKPPPKSTATTVISHLKHSLSVTLHNFYPLTGKLSAPPPPAEPHICYTKGDTLSLTIAESNTNINYLSCNHPRSLANLYSLLPQIPSKFMSRDTHVTLVVPLLAIQITVFHDLGFSIGITAQHIAADERTLDHFMKSWASFSKSLLKKDSFFEFTTPCFNRSVISDPGSYLKTTFLKQWWNRLNAPKDSHEETDHNIVQSTFVLSSQDINVIKHHILVKCKMINIEPPVHLSPYVSACAYIWICLLKVQESHHSKGGSIYLGFNAGGISRLGYEIPPSYFGNCIAFGRCKALKSELLGENGVVFAAKSIGKEIKRLDRDVLGGAERWIWEWDELNFRVLGSPKVDSYGIDFGWGKVEKVEKICSENNDRVNIISLSGSKDLKGGIETGLVLSKDKMTAFTYLFNDGLNVLRNQHEDH